MLESGEAIRDMLVEDFPLWDELTEVQQGHILSAAGFLKLKKGELITPDGDECAGILIVKKGALRFFTISEEGREITFQRLHKGDLSILSASCVLPSINFDIWTEALENCVIVKIKPCALAQIMKQSLPLKAEIYRLATKSLASITVAMQRMLFTSFDKRLAHFLLEESQTQHAHVLKITHEQIAKYIGTAREVVTRMLNQFAEEGYVKLTRGKIEILQRKKLQEIMQGKARK